MLVDVRTSLERVAGDVAKLVIWALTVIRSAFVYLGNKHARAKPEQARNPRRASEIRKFCDDKPPKDVG